MMFKFLKGLFGGGGSDLEKRSRQWESEFYASDKIGGIANESARVLIDTIESNPWVYACIHRIALSATTVPFLLRSEPDVESNEISPALEKEIRQLLYRPNELDFWNDLVYLICCNLELTGESFTEWVIEDGKRMLYPIRSDKVAVIPDELSRIQRYELDLGNRKVTFLPDELVYVRYPDPKSSIRGLPPLKCAIRDLVADYNAVEWNAAKYQNGARPDVIFEAPAGLDESIVKRISNRWWNFYGKVGSKSRPMITEAGIKANFIGHSAEDMEFMNTRKWNRETVLAAFGVPPVMVGIFEYANYANSKEQKELFWRVTMEERLKRIECALSLAVSKLYGTPVHLIFDREEIADLKEDQQQASVTAAALVREGIISRNEARQRLNYERVEAPGMDDLTAAAGSVPVAEMTAPLEPDGNGSLADAAELQEAARLAAAGNYPARNGRNGNAEPLAR